MGNAVALFIKIGSVAFLLAILLLVPGIISLKNVTDNQNTFNTVKHYGYILENNISTNVPEKYIIPCAFLRMRMCLYASAIFINLSYILIGLWSVLIHSENETINISSSWLITFGAVLLIWLILDIVLVTLHNRISQRLANTGESNDN